MATFREQIERDAKAEERHQTTKSVKVGRGVNPKKVRSVLEKQASAIEKAFGQTAKVRFQLANTRTGIDGQYARKLSNYELAGDKIIRGLRQLAKMYAQQ